MNFADSLIKKYDMTDLKTLDDEEIFILWIEITTGLDILDLEENLEFNTLKPINFMLWNNLVTEVKNRNVLEIETIPKIISSNEYATRIENIPRKVQTGDSQRTNRFQCEFCIKRMSKITDLKQHINSTHFGHRFKCSNCNELFARKKNCARHIKIVHPETVVKIVKAIITTQESGTIYNAELQDISIRCKGNMMRIEKVKINSKFFEIINVEKYAIENCLIKCDFCAQLFTSKRSCRRHIKERHCPTQADVQNRPL